MLQFCKCNSSPSMVILGLGPHLGLIDLSNSGSQKGKWYYLGFRPKFRPNWQASLPKPHYRMDLNQHNVGFGPVLQTKIMSNLHKVGFGPVLRTKIMSKIFFFFFYVLKGMAHGFDFRRADTWMQVQTQITAVYWIHDGDDKFDMNIFYIFKLRWKQVKGIQPWH